MGETIVPTSDPSLAKMLSKSLSHFARETVFSLMKKIKCGKLTVIEGGDAFEFGEQSRGDSMVSKVYVRDQLFYPQVMLGGSIGAGEAYMAGYWHSEDLTKVVRLIMMNRDVFADLDKGWAKVMTPFHNLLHFLRKNTEEGSRKNIAAHYDLGNDFYKLFLDDTLTYSCCIFEHDQVTLEDASIAKYDHICRKLDISPRDHVLEIGTGWGGFAIHAAGRYGCQVTTTTISRSQYDLARERIKAAGLEDRVELLLKDYREVDGSYDKLVSIEMIEAVGHHYLGTFLKCCSNLLKPEGMMLLQAITIADYVFEEHKRSVDFIKRYIFPGGCIPSVTAICISAAAETDLRLFHLEDITPHYVTTLQAWHSRFLKNVEQVRRLGYPESFIRMWEFYLCYCEAGFAERYLGDVQMLLTKPLCRRPPILPAFVR
ncbi:MAG: cyclopropane-fatty-acyl-phospholipid synthase family protein [Desulfoferrobacter sp.]